MECITGRVQKSNKAYPNIDIAKIFCAMLVVIIHTSPAQNAGALFRFYLQDVIARIAVPLFFAISGFLFFGKLIYEDGKVQRCKENNQMLIRYMKKMVGLYFLWSVVYLVLVKLPMWYHIGWWGMYVIKDAVAAFLFSGLQYHLWFLLALIYALPILYLLFQRIRIKSSIWIVAVLWLCECLVYSYSWIGINEIEAVAFVAERIPILFDTFFRALPLIAMGHMWQLCHVKLKGSTVVPSLWCFLCCVLWKHLRCTFSHPMRACFRIC